MHKESIFIRAKKVEPKPWNNKKKQETYWGKHVRNDKRAAREKKMKKKGGKMGNQGTWKRKELVFYERKKMKLTQNTTTLVLSHFFRTSGPAPSMQKAF